MTKRGIKRREFVKCPYSTEEHPCKRCKGTGENKHCQIIYNPVIDEEKERLLDQYISEEDRKYFRDNQNFTGDSYYKYIRYGDPQSDIQIFENLEPETPEIIEKKGRSGKFERDEYMTNLEKVCYRMLNDPYNYIVIDQAQRTTDDLSKISQAE